MILRDPVHGLIPFDNAESEIVVRLMATPEVQRLRRVRQLGVTSVAFPGAEHTRFSHAIGAAHVMNRLIARLRDVEGDLAAHHRLGKESAREALAAAFLHDVGHGPLSHLFEDALSGAPPHEEWSTRIILDGDSEVSKILAEFDPRLPARVAELVLGRHELTYLARAVSGTLDVDRCDYLLRDAHATGVPYGRYDLDWLLRALTFAPSSGGREAPPLAIDGAKGIVSLESFILARLFMFQQVYFHKAARAAEWMIRAILTRAAEILRQGVALPAVPPAIASIVRRQSATLGEYLELDDAVIFNTLHAWEGSHDRILSDLTRRIRGRSLFKTLELYGMDAPAREQALATARDIAHRAGFDKESYVGLDIATDVPFTDEEDPLTVVFPKGVTRKPVEVSFLLRRLCGEDVTRARLIFAPELRETIEATVAP
ncbi:MAG TPA: HD domain-containing protein [Polyangiaceae bacterium]|nr:HD domain-containing protein [Polyangiaceae bacterium]